MIVTDSALDGSGGLSGWLALGSARRVAGLRCALKSVLHWENDADGDDELAMAPRAEDQHDKPERFARDMREASNWRAHGFQGIITKRQGLDYAPRPRS